MHAASRRSRRCARVRRGAGPRPRRRSWRGPCRGSAARRSGRRARAMRSAAMPSSRKRFSNRARFVFDPISPTIREPAGERLGRDGEVERMVMGHHQHERVRRRSADLGGRIVRVDWACIGGNVRRKGIVPGVDPARSRRAAAPAPGRSARPTWPAPNREGVRSPVARHSRRAGDLALTRPSPAGIRPKAPCSASAAPVAVEGLDQRASRARRSIGRDRGRAPSMQPRRPVASRQHRRRAAASACHSSCPPPMVPWKAPSGAHDHAGAGLARRRALASCDGHQRGGAVLARRISARRRQTASRHRPPAHAPRTARRIASGVAGASSGTG